jgi:trans-aconitate methyltransferase
MTDAWNGSLYAANTAHHRKHDAEFLETLEIRPTDHILDLGAGVGDFTKSLAALSEGGRILGVDASPSQIDLAMQSTTPGVEFRVGRAQDLDRVVHGETFDLVVSRAVLHWIPGTEHPRVLTAVLNVLRPGGVFRAEFGGDGQIAAVREVLDEESERLGGPRSPWFFPTAEAYRALLETVGFRLSAGFVRLLHQRRAMPTAEALVEYLRSQVFLAYDGGMDSERRDRFRERCADRVRKELRRADGSYDLDFVRLDLLAHGAT